MDNLINAPTNNSKKNSITQGIGYLNQTKQHTYGSPQPYNNNTCGNSNINNNKNMNKNYSLIEGFDGMIGPTRANNKNMKDHEELTKQEDELNRSLSTYASSYKTLVDKAQNFLQNRTTYGKSIYTPQAENPDLIKSNWVGCYKKGSDGLIDQDMGDMANIDTCKIRASDLGQSVFSLYKSDETSNNIKCAVGDDINKAKSLGLSVIPVVSYNFSKANGANTAELLYNGQIGTYTDSVNNNLVTDLNPHTDCDLLLGKSINTNNTVATYGYNCNGTEKSKFKPPPVVQPTSISDTVPDGYTEYKDKYYAKELYATYTDGESINNLAETCSRNDNCIGFGDGVMVSSVGLLNTNKSSSQIEGFENRLEQINKESVYYLKNNAVTNIDTSKTYKLMNVVGNNGRLYSNADGRFGVTTGGELVDQYWNLVPTPNRNNVFKIKSLNSKELLTNDFSGRVNVMPEYKEDEDQSLAGQDWELIPVNGQPDTYQLKNTYMHLCLYNGYDIGSVTCSQKTQNSAQQFWKLIPVEEQTPTPINCDQYRDTDTDKNLPDECLNKLWREAGCTTNLQDSVMAPYYKNKTIAEIKYDMNAYATWPDSVHRHACYAPVPIKKSGITMNTTTLWDKPWIPVESSTTGVQIYSLCQLKDGTILGSNIEGKMYVKKNGIYSLWYDISKEWNFMPDQIPCSATTLKAICPCDEVLPGRCLLGCSPAWVDDTHTASKNWCRDGNSGMCDPYFACGKPPPMTSQILIKDMIQLNNGQYLMVDKNGKLYIRDEKSDMGVFYGGWKSAYPNNQMDSFLSITQLHNGDILGVNSSNNKIYYKKNLLDDWKLIKCPSSCCVTNISTMNNGSIVGVGSDGYIYTKTTLNNEWVLVDNSKKMASVIQLQDGTIMSTDTNGNTFIKKMS